MSLIAKQLLIVWRRCFDDFKVVVIKTNIVDYIFRYVCLKYYRILNRRIFIYFKEISNEKSTYNRNYRTGWFLFS